MKSVCIFEDDIYQNFLPLAYSRPVYELRCGMYSFLERIVLQYPDTEINLYCREYLKNLTAESHPHSINKIGSNDKGCLFINGRLLLSTPIPITGKEEIGICDDAIVYARLNRKNSLSITSEKFLEKGFIHELKKKINVKAVDASLIQYPWDLIHTNKEQIISDFKTYVKTDPALEGKYKGVHFIMDSQIYIGKNTVIKPGSVLDAENGPIYIGNNVKISANSVIQGPAFIDDDVVIQALSRINAGSNIGRVCKVGGEISNTIIQSYSNKQHYGFLGDSYIGAWVNLGAGTVNSNLTNLYGSIKVQLSDKIIDTGQTFLGMIVGDHTKTAINTKITTGSIIGFACNILMTSTPPKFSPSFSWYSDNVTRAYDITRELQVAKRMMARRNKEMTRNGEKVFKTIFALSETERKIHDN
ncbi:MAG: putative sugar nucleotidyl transferase [Candidatus Scalindua sp.]|jgi:UDP-N-acetylglucosamine diphosphorylase/glucosamine-1-phosphate N-acetyltransferase|nr:putative sugar nucleotidyl transferase [Candidatus Scalindua sp.]MDV5167185.1 putative sugar nucleotidyl transferase [Candidatus Scalindua sp.]